MTIATIGSLGQRGEGVAEIDGSRVYVPFTLPGETAEITVEGERGTLRSLLTQSPHRIAPFCPHFGLCGGCQLQHLDPESYTQFKRGLIETALSHVGVAAAIAPLIDAKGTGRRRITLHARKSGAGFVAFHTHDLHDIDTCPITVPALAAAPGVARAVYAAIGDCDVALTSTLTGIDVNIKPERKARPERLTTLIGRFGLARLSLDGETILQARIPVLRMGKAMAEIPPGSFLQATAAAEETLAGLVVVALAGAQNIADLFCGIGPFALRLAEQARIYAADSDKAGIAALIKAHNNTRGLKTIAAERRDLFREPLTAIELARFDGLVFDPPRAGAEAQAREIAKSKVKTVVAVS
ncbi:MAG: RNA methyltransferase, partial [Devosia sp.]